MTIFKLFTASIMMAFGISEGLYAMETNIGLTKDIYRIDDLDFEQEAQTYLKELKESDSRIDEDEQKARVDIEKKIANFEAKASMLSQTARQNLENQLRNEFVELQNQFSKRRFDNSEKRKKIMRRLAQML